MLRSDGKIYWPHPEFVCLDGKLFFGSVDDPAEDKARKVMDVCRWMIQPFSAQLSSGFPHLTSKPRWLEDTSTTPSSPCSVFPRVLVLSQPYELMAS